MMHRRALFLILIAALLVEIASCGGHSAPPVSVTVSSGVLTSIPVNGNVLFSATVVNSSNQNVTWAVVGGAANGTIAQSGLYTAPALVPNPATVTVTATPQADPSIVGQASITVTVRVSVTPTSTTLQTLGTATFTATVQGSANQGVNWEVNGIAGGNISVGTITQGGVYQAPESVPVNTANGKTITMLTVQAFSQADPSVVAFASVTVTTTNQLGQNLPVKLGTSGGNINDVNARECASGTLGSLVTRAGVQYILSNNHVLADSDAGNIGDGITQPGLIDAPSPCLSGGTNIVANLSQFITLEQPVNCTKNCAPPADAAIAQVVANDVNAGGTIIQLGDSATGGIPTDEAPASTILPVASLIPNMTAVAKSGRSTGLTCSTIEATGVDIQVQYQHGLGGANFTATYTNQISVNSGIFSAEGDSGSLIVSQAGAQPIALLYAGNSTDTVGAPAATVLANFPNSNNVTPTFVGPATRNAVTGCTSTGADAFSGTGSQNSAAQQSATVAPSAAQIAQAESVKDQNAYNLMSDPAVLAVGVAPSLDRPNRAAVVIFVHKGEQLAHSPAHNLGGVPTRVIAVDALPQTGVLDQDTTAAFLKTAGRVSGSAAVHPTPEQFATARAVKEKYSASLMKQPGILGVGVTSSLDNPGEPAILVYVETGKSHNPIPLEFDGIRVRVKTTDKFRAFSWGHPKPRQ